MRHCEHDPVFSGRTNTRGHFEYICRRCGDLGFSATYSLPNVHAEEFYQQRCAHGWATPRLPSPPPLPTNTTPPGLRDWHWVPWVIFFTLLAAACALASIPWGALGPVMPLWMSMLGAGLGLGTATVCYVAWKKGL